MRATNSNSDYEIIIQPNRNWFYVDWKGLWHYRDLLFLMIRRDFFAQFKQTVLGPLWFVIAPLGTTLVYTVIFGNIAKIPTDGLPPMLFYLCGLLAWGYFGRTMGAASGSLRGKAGLYNKIYFPRLIIPITGLFSGLIPLVTQLGTFLSFFVYFKYFTPAGSSINPNLFIFVLPFLLFQAGMVGIGVGLWRAALTAKYRDLGYLFGFLTSLWMYATPIIYPISLVPEKWRFAMAFNPMASVVESFRYAFLGKGILNFWYFVVSAFVAALLLFSGVLIFNKTERTFLDTV